MYLSQMVSATSVDVDVYEDDVIFVGAWEVDTHRDVIIKKPSARNAQDLTSFKTRMNSYRDAGEARLRVRSIAFLRKLKVPLIVPQFTATGYERREIPEDLYRRLVTYYRANYYKRYREKTDNSDVINQVEVPTSAVHLPHDLSADIETSLGPVLAEWVGEELVLSAIYGVRVYHRGSVLRSHVDRVETHAVAAILHIDRDLGGAPDWPLEVVTFTGDRDLVYLQPGEMLLYESTRLIHARTQPFRGISYANVFVHFVPPDWPYTNGGDPHGGVGTQDFYEIFYPLHSPLTEGVGGQGLPQELEETTTTTTTTPPPLPLDSPDTHDEL